MINTIFHFVNDPTFDYQTAVNNGDISEYTIVFNSADHSIHCKGTMFGRMSRADIAETLGNISDLIPVATDSTLGGIKIGYTNNADQNSRRYGVVLDDNNKAYVEVPWTDTITPDFDDTELKNLIATERSRIDNFISTLSDTIDAKNRQLFADTQWVEEVFGIPQAEGSIWQKFENEIDHYLNEYMVWDWVDPNDHTKGRTAKISSIEQNIDGITTRVGSAESSIDGLTTTTSTLTQRADAIETRVGAVETKANGIDTALSSFEQTVNTEIGGIKTAHTNLSSSVASYETTNDGNIGNLIKMAAAVLDLKASSDAEGNLSTTTDLANVITNGSFSGYSGLSQRVSQTESGVSANASLIADVQDTIEGLDIDGAVTRATAGFATETWVGQHYDTIGSAATAESNAKGYADDIVAGAKADVIASIDDTVAGMSVLVTKDSSGYIDSNIYLKANQIYLDGQTNFKTAVGAFVKTDVLEAGVADIKARLTVGGSDPAGSGTSGSITMKNASDGTIGIWDKDKLAVGTTSSPSSSNSAMLVNADGSGSLSKGNISWNTNGDVSVNGTGQFNGDVYANQFRAGSTSTFNITVESDAINFNYGSTRQAWFSTKKLEMNSNGEIVDTGNDAPQGFYLYMISPRTGNLVTIDFESGMFVEVTNGAVTVHTDSNTVKEITAGSYGTVAISNKTIYYTTDTSGSTPVNTYYWNSECTNQITGNLSDASHNYYLVVGDKYVVVNEDTGTGRSPMLRRVTIYQPAKYDGNAHRIVSYGDRVYVIDKGTVSVPDKCFVVSLSSTAATLYNTSVYMENTTTTLDNMSSNMRLASGSGSVQVYVATKSAGSSIPTLTNTLSIFTPGSGPNSPSMTKVDYTVS